jgi:hypothetical protein
MGRKVRKTLNIDADKLKRAREYLGLDTEAEVIDRLLDDCDFERELVLLLKEAPASFLALFDLLFKEQISKADREKLKQASKTLLASLRQLLARMHDWTQNTTTQAEVKVFILDNLWRSLPRPPFTEEETQGIAGRIYDYVWERSASGTGLLAA